MCHSRCICVVQSNKEARHGSCLRKRRMAGNRLVPTNMQTHTEVIENFLTKGERGTGTYIKATDDLLYSRIPSGYRPFGREPWGETGAGHEAPLAVRLEDGSLLANGARLLHPMDNHQWSVLKALEDTHSQFGVVPFHSIAAAWTDGAYDDWDRAPIGLADLKAEVAVIVPSQGEHWRQVTYKDKDGRTRARSVHTLGDSVVRVKDRYYLSAVDETGEGNGMYFLAELATDQPPETLEAAFDRLKPKTVREAEARGLGVLRQGEWFAIPTNHRTSELMRDTEAGIAVRRELHVLGKDGHHELEEAVIYEHGPRKGEVYARGVLRHTKGEHVDLNLGTVRWYLIIHNVTGASYTLSGKGTAQFD